MNLVSAFVQVAASRGLLATNRVTERAVIGRGKLKLVDTRPAERNSDGPQAQLSAEARTIAWTHYFGKEDTYSRIDYILLSPGMAREWLSQGTYVLTAPDWGAGSDHRPLVAEFETTDR